jgi:drug/metabolite transporter (DMT)-like permease
MALDPVLAALSALCGNFILSLGMVLQKGHVQWIGFKGRKSSAWRRDVLGWSAGFMLMNLAPIGNYAALFGLPANVVSALMGSNVAFTAVLAALVLHEKIGARRLVWSGLLFVGLAAAGLRSEAPGAALVLPAFWLFAALPAAFGLFAAAARAKMRGSALAAFIAAASGCLGGSMVLSMRALQVGAAPSLAGWLASPFLYTYFFEGLLSFFLVNLAYKDGEMSLVSPAYYGMQVLWPAVASYAVLGAAFDPLQATAFAVIAFAVLMISRA